MNCLRWLRMNCALFLTGAATVAAESFNWQPLERKAHQTEWAIRDSEGKVTASYIELQSGLNRQDETGAWVPASAAIEIFERGAIVRRAQFQAIFPGMSDDPHGTFDISLPSGAGRFRGQCVGLAYTASNGDSVFIGELRNVQGVLVGDNEILYQDCFSGPIKADLRYRVTLGGVVQDVILRTKPPQPAEFGLPDGRLEVWTQVLNAPQVRKTVLQSKTKKGKNASDSVLDFGPMQIGGGKAHPDMPGRELALGSIVRVHKEYEQIQGMTFLIEGVELEDIAEDVATLPVRQEARIDLPRVKERLQARLALVGRQKPVSLAAAAKPELPRTEPAPVRKMAMAELRREPGYVLDFDLAGSYTDYTFRSDTTYYVTGSINLYGVNNVFEGGAVLKYAPTNSASVNIQLNAGAVFNTTPYTPVIMCARDDHSAGQKLNSNALTSADVYYNALGFQPSASCPAIDFKHLRISDAYYGISFYGNSGGQYNQVRHVQFVRCSQEFLVNLTYLNLRNVLFDGGGGPTDSATCNITAVNATINGEHVTVNRSKKFFQNWGSVTLKMTNSLFISVTNTGSSFTSVSCQTSSSFAGVFQETGAGKFYLATSSPYRDAGISTINATLAAELQTMTTYPPLLLQSSTTIDTLLAPQAPTDLGLPDLGYHYPRMDYLMDFMSVGSATLTIKNGAVIGTCFGSGLQLKEGGHFISEGTPKTPNRFVEYAMVQEQPIRLEQNSSIPSVTVSAEATTHTLTRTANLRFTEFIGWMDRTHYLQTNSGSSAYLDALSVRDCQFRRGNVGISPTQTSLTSDWVNNLFERVTMYVDDVNYFTFYNNLHREGATTFKNSTANRITVKDTAFHSVANTVNSTALVNDYNVYISANRLTPNGANDPPSPSVTYAAGPLGSYYHSASSGFVDEGAVNADVRKLYHYTQVSALSKETTSLVDIGFHYVATDSNGIPKDDDGDGLPDYLEDTDGDGTPDSGETHWQQSNGAGTGAATLIVFTPLQ